MAISGISSNHDFSNITALKPSVPDTSSKTLQTQLANKEQSLNRLSSDSKLSEEEKNKERLELQKQIAELNRKLRMLRLEKEEETKETQKEQEKKAALIENEIQNSSEKDSAANTTEDLLKEKEEKPVNIPPQNIQKFLEAGTQLQKERIQQNMEQKKESSENILEAEIKSDKLYGTDTTAKEEQLSSLLKKKTFEINVKESENSKNFSKEKTPVKVVIREEDFSPT